MHINRDEYLGVRFVDGAGDGIEDTYGLSKIDPFIQLAQPVQPVRKPNDRYPAWVLPGSEPISPKTSDPLPTLA